MTIQARLKEDTTYYNTNRDIAHNFKGVVTTVAARLEDGTWPELSALLDREGITQDQLGDACQAFIKFMLTSVDVPEDDMLACLTKADWFKVSPTAQVAYLAVMGQVLAGYYFAGVREATLGGEGPVLTYKDLDVRGKECAEIMSMPAWRRGLSRRWKKFRQGLRLMFGQ